MKTKIFVTVVFALLLMISSVQAIESQSNETVSAETIDQLIQELGSSNTTIKSNAAKTLVDIGDPAVDPLISALNDENYDIRENAALVLGKIGNETAIDPLILSLSEQDWEETEEEREFGKSLEIALGSFGESAVEPLSKFIEGKEYSDSVGHSIAALEPIGEPAVPVLVQLLYTDLRVEAAYHLRMIGEPAVDYLIPLLDDEDPKVQGRAAEALVGTSNPDVIEPLTRLLGDDDEYVRNRARHALESMENQLPETESFLYGREREFFVEDEKREWLSSLEPIVKGRSEYIMPYLYPDGPVIGYGLYYKGYLTVDLLIGSEVNESYMAEIYSVIDEEAQKHGVKEVPVLFSYTSMAVDDVEVEIPDELLELTTDEDASKIMLPAGFMAVMLFILVIGVLLSRKT
nr:HEAT repeat domain-containing protein [uncultured Methanolobus sp.]